VHEAFVADLVERFHLSRQRLRPDLDALIRTEPAVGPMTTRPFSLVAIPASD